MNRTDALKELLAKVEAGTFKSWRDGMVFGDFKEHLAMMAYKAHHGSLDAAKALHEAVLPGWRARIDIGRRFRAWTIGPENQKVDAYADAPSRAWLIAILKALIAEANGREGGE